MAKKHTKKALFTSVMSLVLCFAMLVGTTFAWFTDSVSSGVNTIQSGNLDIGVYYALPSDVVDGDIRAENWQPVKQDESLFNNEALWEPGYTEAVFLKFVNEGSLALEYQLGVDILSEEIGKSMVGNDIQLSNYIQAYACNSFYWDYKDYLFTSREDAIDPAGAPDPFYDTLFNAANGAVNTPNNENPLSMDSWQWLDVEETTYATIVLWMPTSVGNEANHDGEHFPSIKLGLNVVATQYNAVHEKESFDNNYDQDAAFPNPVSNAADLVAMLKVGKNVVMTEDIADASVGTTAPYSNSCGIAQNSGVLDGNGKTLDFENEGKKDNYGIMTSGGTIKNVTITGVFRGIMIMDPTEDVYIDNVTIGGDEDMCYGVNTGEGDGTKKVVITNSDLKGWNSFGNTIKSLEFTNCTFGQGTYYKNVYGRLVKPYVDTVFENCEFSSQFYIDLSAFVGEKVVLRNCTVNGVKLTAENWTQLIAAEDICAEDQISIEAKDGSYMTAGNILDYVVIE